MTPRISRTNFTNEKAGATFFALFIVFFVIFMFNMYTMNLVFSIIMLQFSLHFKQCHLIREVQKEVREMRK